MRKAVFLFFILVGAAVGVFGALNESVGLKIVFGSIGAVAGTAVGGALSGVGRKRHRPMVHFEGADGLAELRCAPALDWLRGKLPHEQA